jgi:exonuclease SbcC
MVPKKLTLKNFRGIKSGLGRDEIVIDFEKLTDGAQLVAIVGPNGSGKSTILDNAHAFRVMPSRAGSYSPASFSFYENTYGSEASKILEWEHAGHHYRSELIFKMGSKTKKTEAYLFENDAPVRLADGTVSDGKTEVYDRCIEAILGTPEMFFSAVFASQNRRPLSSYTNGEIKGLLSELLGLEHIRELGGKAGDVTKALKINLESLRADLLRVEQLEAERASAEARLDGDKASMSMTAQAKAQARTAVTAALKRLADVKADLGSSVEVEAHRASLQARYNGIQQTAAGTLRQLDTDIQDEHRRLTVAKAAAVTEQDNLKRQIAALEAQIADNEKLMARKAEIEAAQSSLPILEQEDADATAALDAARAKDMEARALVSEQTSLKSRLNAIANEGKTLVATCDSLKNRAILIEQVPCQGTELQPKCPLLAEAITARGKIPEAETTAQTKRDEYNKIAERGAEVEGLLKQMVGTGAAVKTAEDKKQQIATRIKAVTQVAGLASGLSQAQKTIDVAKEQKDGIAQTLLSSRNRSEESEREATERLNELGIRRAGIEMQAKKDRDGVQMELDALPPPADQMVLGKAEMEVENAETTQAQIDGQADTLNAKIAAGKERIRSLLEQTEKAGAVRSTATMLEYEIAQWTTLAKALGNDGVIALCIDDAGPTLASLANDLLASCYGSRFSIRIQTQEQTQKGAMKEGFDVIVFDSERDEEKSVGAMSGGERIYINDVLTRAIALYQAQLSGRQYGSIFSDEADGALDSDKKLEFIKVKREVLRIGKYSKEFYISHSKEVQDCADVVIDMEAFRV